MSVPGHNSRNAQEFERWKFYRTHVGLTANTHDACDCFQVPCAGVRLHGPGQLLHPMWPAGKTCTGPSREPWLHAPSIYPARDNTSRLETDKGIPRTPTRARLPLLPSGPGGFNEVIPHGGSGTRLRISQCSTEVRPWVASATEDSPSGLWRSLGKRVGLTPSGVRIPYPPPLGSLNCPHNSGLTLVQTWGKTPCYKNGR